MRIERQAAVVVGALLIAVVGAAALRSVPDAPGDAGAAVATRLPDRRVDINTATPAELSLLPRIGPVLAEAIVEDRARNGPFASIDELSRVRGIGPKTIDRLRTLVICTPPAR